MREKLEFELRCQAALEGTCTEEEFRRLEQELRDSPDLRQVFRETFLMHEMLAAQEELFAPQVECGPAPTRGRFVLRATLTAAAAVVLGFFALKLVPGTPTLRITAGPHSKYVVDHGAGGTGRGDDLEPGAAVTLSEGTLELDFANGVQSIVQAPASFVLQSAGQLKMEMGTARFQVPENAKGFTVVTPRLEVVDLGTSFGVVELPDEPAQAHVFEGEIQAKTRLETNMTLLKAGAAVEKSAQGRLVEVPLDDSRFFKTLPWDLPFVHLSFEPDESGALYVEGCHPSLGSSTVALHPDGPGLADGVIGKAARFSGGTTPVTSNWRGVGGAVPRTICAWIRQQPGLPPRRFQTIVGWGDPTIGLAAKCEILLYQPLTGNSTVLRLSFDQYLYSGTTDLADGRWHHVAAVCLTDPTGKMPPTVELYVDGRRETIDPRESTTNPWIGRRPDTRVGEKGSMPLVVGYTDRPGPDRGFRGEIDEVYVFEGALPEQRIIQLATPPKRLD